MYAMPGRMGHQSMIKVNVSNPRVWCSQDKEAIEPRKSSGCSLHHRLPNLLIVFEQWKVLWELNLVWKSSAKMCICLGHLGNDVQGINCLLMDLWPLGTLGWIWTTCKGYLVNEYLGTGEGIQGNDECFKKPAAV